MKTRRRATTFLFILAVVLISAGFIRAGVVASAEGISLNTFLQKEIAQVDSRQKLIAEVTSPEMKNSLEQKQAALDYAAQVRATAQAQPAVKPSDPCALRPTPDVELSHRERGIIAEGAPLPQMKQLIIENAWIDYIDGWWIEVAAGATMDDFEQGILVITGEDERLFGQFTTPNRTGALEIIHADGDRLTLQSKSGQIYYFDVPARSYVSSLEEIVPALPAVPTPQPTADICSQ